MRQLESLAKKPDARDWLKGGPEGWANESLLVGRRAYEISGSDTTLRSGDSIGRAYEQENTPKATDRLARSGIRLAAMLEEVFKDANPRVNPQRGIQRHEKAVPARQ